MNKNELPQGLLPLVNGKKKRFNICMDPNVMADLDRLAKKRLISRSAILEYLSQELIEGRISLPSEGGGE